MFSPPLKKSIVFLKYALKMDLVKGAWFDLYVLKTTGTEINKLMPPVSRFGGSGRAKKKQGVIEKLKAFFEKYFGLGITEMQSEKEEN